MFGIYILKVHFSYFYCICCYNVELGFELLCFIVYVIQDFKVYMLCMMKDFEI